MATVLWQTGRIEINESFDYRYRSNVMSESENNKLTSRECDNCKGAVGIKDKMCPKCGFSLTPVRSTKAKWKGISFPVFVFWVSVFCVLMILWLPR